MVKVNVSAADMGFELWHEGVKLSRDTSIKVEWHASAPPVRQTEEVGSAFDMSALDLGKVLMARYQTLNNSGVGVGY